MQAVAPALLLLLLVVLLRLQRQAGDQQSE